MLQAMERFPGCFERKGSIIISDCQKKQSKFSEIQRNSVREDAGDLVAQDMMGRGRHIAMVVAIELEYLHIGMTG